MAGPVKHHWLRDTIHASLASESSCRLLGPEPDREMVGRRAVPRMFNLRANGENMRRDDVKVDGACVVT